MVDTSELRNTAETVEFTIVVAMPSSIMQGSYQVGREQVEVSYDSSIPFGYPVGDIRWQEELPKEVSVVFRVRWPDLGGKTRARLTPGSGSARPELVLERALGAVNALIEAHRLVRVGHSEGISLRTLGVADTLLYECFVGGNGPLIVNQRIRGRGGADPLLRRETNELALPHIATATYPVARRFLKCFELFERSYFNEATVLAHGILDDVTQSALKAIMCTQGLGEAEASELVRSITEGRLRRYLGPVMKVLTGRDVSDAWPSAFEALKFLNDQRNNIAHNGFECSRAQAAHCLFAATALASILHRLGIAEVQFPPGMLRTARIYSSWTLDRPRFAPNTDTEELDPWDWPIN